MKKAKDKSVKIGKNVIRHLWLRTNGEELWLWRKDKGLKQSAAAKRLGVSRATYWTYENDLQKVPPEGRWKPIEPSRPLLLALARRRAGLNLRAAARALGCSHVTYLDWERKGELILVDWWKRQRFTFV